MTDTIEARGIRVHNLRNVDVSIPLGQLTVVTGVSGSGKSSLAFDTLYAEGQRRYVECFSTWARQYLDQLPRPDVDRVDRIPPAVAIRQHHRNSSARATVGTATEIDDYLRLLFSRVGTQMCPDCDATVVSHSPESVVDDLLNLDEGIRIQIGFEPSEATAGGDLIDTLRSEGLQRIVVDDRTLRIDEVSELPADGRIIVVLDRLNSGSGRPRITESIETALSLGDGQCCVLSESNDGDTIRIDERDWRRQVFSERPACPRCWREFEPLVPQSVSFNSPRGACPACSGYGSQPTFSFDKVVPDPTVSLEDGAIAPWTTPAYQHELDELLELAPDYGIPVDVPFSDLTPEHRTLIAEGVPERDFGGLRGFFDWLQRNRYKKGVGVFLSRWRSFKTCRDCDGSRLNADARAVRLAGRSLPDVAGMTVAAAADCIESLADELDQTDRRVAAPLLNEVTTRLRYLIHSGIGYVTLRRSMRTLSGGEAQRIALTAALGSNLVNTLYVLDEPTAGLHPADTKKIISSVRQLRDAGNTVIVVEHDPDFMLAADRIVDVGPGAGSGGGEIVAAGSLDEVLNNDASATAGWFHNRNRQDQTPRETRKPRGKVRLSGVHTHNIRNQTIDFPMGVLCVVTGVSGCGKSSLVEQTLYPALCRRFGRECPVDDVGSWESLSGTEELANVVMVDQQPIGRTPRSIPATYLKVFSDIRSLFAETTEAKTRAFTPGTFSFNTSTGGRCPKCEGAGFVTIDMQFMADVEMVCPECDGTRYRPEVLEVRYRGLSIADVLNQTADDAFTLFRGRGRLQKKLKVLRDTGLGYLPLGQPATTLSGGEAQRLKMASHLAGLALKAQRQTRSDRFATLFLLDEPSVGLHGTDVGILLKCFDALLEAGHSLIVVEHNREIIAAADHIIDMGPGAGDDGGLVVASGTPQDIMQAADSQTAAVLKGNL